MAATANDKVIRIRSDINAAIADAKRLQQAYSSIAGVNPQLAAMVNNLNGVQGATSRVGGAANAANNNVKSLVGNLGGLGNAANAAMSKIGGMGGTLTGIGFAGAAAGITAVAGALTALGAASVSAAAHAEAQKASLATVTGSVLKAQETYAALVNFAAKTPFDVNQAVDGYIKLRALGLEPSERAMMSYGNTASALGRNLSDMVEAVADASTGEFERLKGFGITTKQEADKVKFTFGGVTTEVAKNSAAIQKYLVELGETKFGDAMSRQMLTFNGALSNLGDAWDQTLVSIGEGGLLDAVGNAIKLITDGITAIGPVLGSIGNLMGGVISGVTSIVSGIGSLFSVINSGGGSGVTLLERITFQFNMIGQVAEVIGSIVGGVFSAIGTGISEASSLLNGAFGSALDFIGIKFDQGGRSWTNSLFGILRAGKAVAMALPDIFKIAITDLMSAFSTLGQAIGALLTGQWAKAKELASKPLFTNTDRAIGAAGRIATATYRDEGAADAAMNRMLGRNAKTNAKLDDGSTPPGAQSGSNKDKDAAKKAAERAKREGEFWQSMKDQLATAGMLSNAAEVYNKQLELRKIVERDLTDGEKLRVANALGEINAAKQITGLKQKAFEAANEYTVELGRAKGLTDAQRGVEDELFKARLDSLNKGVDINAAAYKQAEDALRKQLEKNAALKEQNELLKKAQDFAVNMSSGARAADDLKKLNADYQAYLAKIADGSLAATFRDEILAGKNAAELRIKQDAIRVLLEMSPSLDRDARAASAVKDANIARAQLASLHLSPQAQKEAEEDIHNSLGKALGKIASETTSEWVDQFDDLADYFGGRLGTVLKKFADGFDTIAEMASGKLTGPAGFVAKLLNRQGTYQDAVSDPNKGFTVDAIGKQLGSPLKSLSQGFGDFKSMFSGDLATGLVKGLSKMQAGAQVGGMVAGVGDLLGLGKGFSTGSQIGGAVGGLFGPIGSIIGSLGGGLIGSLFGSSKKYATATLTGTGDATVSGNKASLKKDATGAAGSVQDGLASLASQLGGVVSSYDLMIGQYDGKWRVRDTSTGWNGKGGMNFKGDSAAGLHDFGDDQAAAIAYAITNAVADGAITGLDPIIQKALGALGTDSAIQFAKDWKSAMDDYKSLIDPITSAVDAIIDPLNTLRDTMVKVGASTDDLTKIDDYRTIKLKAALKEQLSSLTDFLDQLKGDGSGTTKLDQLNAKMAEFDSYKDRIAKGDSTVDQSAFTSLGQSIFGLAGDIYGTATSQFQDIRTMLTGATQGLADNVTNAFNTAAGFDVANASTSLDSTTAAVQAQAAAQAAYYQQQANSNALQESYLKQIAAAVSGSGGIPSYKFANDDYSYNGIYGGLTY